MVNRSAPGGPIVPQVSYPDVASAIDWLCAAFGFSERLRVTGPDGAVGHAQLRIGEGGVVLRPAGPGQGSGMAADGILPFSVRVGDVDRHHARAAERGARIAEPPTTHPWGERTYRALDLAGHRWTFAHSVADVEPAAWGAEGRDLWGEFSARPRPSFCYLQIPATDVRRSMAFYEGVFGWNIRGREGPNPSFDDAAGRISGSWAAGWPPSREAGLLPSIWVDSIDATLGRVAACGGEIVEPPRRDAPDPGAQWIARFRDPAGNVLGLYQEGPR